jgi:hypothetical protein
MTVEQALNLFKLNVARSQLIAEQNSDSEHVKALRVEAADTAMILVIVDDYSVPK